RRRKADIRSSPRKRGPRATDCGPWIPACAGMNGIERRAFITLLGATAAWPLAAHAQQSPVPVIALVNPGSREASASRVAAFRKGLGETGYLEGQNVAVEYHWVSGEYDRLPTLMADLVRRRVAVIAPPGSSPAASAAKAATNAVPSAEATSRELPEAARAIGLQIQILNASTSREIEAAFAALVRDRADALFVAPDSFFISRRLQ